jgi:hypothetical protein
MLLLVEPGYSSGEKRNSVLEPTLEAERARAAPEAEVAMDIVVPTTELM